MYVTTNSPYILSQAGLGRGRALWVYDCAGTDDHTCAQVEGFFTNARSIGMKANDIVLVVSPTQGLWNTLQDQSEVISYPRLTFHLVESLNAAGAATISPVAMGGASGPRSNYIPEGATS